MVQHHNSCIQRLLVAGRGAQNRMEIMQLISVHAVRRVCARRVRGHSDSEATYVCPVRSTRDCVWYVVDYGNRYTVLYLPRERDC